MATLLVTLTVFLPVRLAGNGLRIPSQDAFATARGEAFVATADNPSAVFYNPAGIAGVPGLQSRSTFTGLYYDTSFRPPEGAPNAGETYHGEEQFAFIPQFFASYAPTNHSLAYGFGIYAPYGGKMTWPQDTGFRTVATEGAVTTITLHPSLAWRISPKLFVGAGAMVTYGKLDFEQGLLRNEQPFANRFRFVGEGWMAGFNAGVLWRPVEALSVGATFRSSMSLDAQGETRFEQQPVIQPTELDARAVYDFPFSVAFGVSYRPTPDWNIEVNADYTDWSSFDTTTIRQATAPPFPVQQNINVQLGWQASWYYQLGVTRYLKDRWQVSAGYVFSENSVPDTFYSPAAADLDRHVFSLGGGYRWQRTTLDVVYQFAYGPAHEVSGSTPSSQPAQFAGQTADGTYEFISHALMVSIGMRF